MKCKKLIVRFEDEGFKDYEFPLKWLDIYEEVYIRAGHE